MIYTYIIRTVNNEFYCGFTNNLERRMKEHLIEINKQWFFYNDRKVFIDVICFKGNHEKKIKTFGVKRFYKMIMEVEPIDIIKIYDSSPLGLLS